MMITLMLCAVLSQSAPPALAVHIRAKPYFNGNFIEPVDRDVATIVGTLAKDLGRYAGLRVVDRPDDADVVLSVAFRRVDTQEDGAIAVPIGRAVIAAPTYTTAETIAVDLSAGGTFVKLLTARSGSTKKATDAIAKDVAAWINANLVTLHANQKGAVPGVSQDHQGTCYDLRQLAASRARVGISNTSLNDVCPAFKFSDAECHACLGGIVK